MKLLAAAACALSLLAIGLVAQAQPASFRQAYQREKTQLTADTDALRAQLTKLKTKNAKQEGALRGEIKIKTSRLATLKLDADALEDKQRGLEEQLAVGVDRGDVVDTMLETAALSMKKLNEDISLEGEQIEVLDRVFDRGISRVQVLGTVHIHDDPFFDEGGVERRGKVVHIGRVAALGVSDDGAYGGVLTLAPGGGWMVVDGSQIERVRALARGEPLSQVPVHLCDPLSAAHELRKERTWKDVANAGGIIAWVIIGLAGLVLLIIFERSLALALVAGRPGAVLSATTALLRKSPERAAAALAKRWGALARVLRSVLDQQGQPREHLEEVAAEAIFREMPKLERLVPLLGVIAAAAPLLGLLGTVTGMISTFEVITEHGTGDPKLLSSGISEALITTEFGLIVAVPTLLAHHLLARWSDRIQSGLETGSLAVINELDRLPPDQGEDDG